MIKLKGCPKCRGDLYLNRDIYGKYLTCLQCGYMKDLATEVKTEVHGPVVGDQERKAA